MTPSSSETSLSRTKGIRRLRVAALSAIALAFLAVAGLVVAGLWMRHDEITRDGRGGAESLARILSEDLAIRIESIEEALFELAAFSRFIGGPNAAGQEWMTLLRATAAGRHGFEALMVTDADGRTTFSSMPMLMGESRAGGTAFRALSEDPRNDALIADEPKRSSNDSKIVVPLSRVIRTPNAEFEGMAIANFAPEQLRAFYRDIDVGANGIVWLLKPPDRVLLREPPSADPNDEPWPDALVEEISPGQAGVATGPVARGGPDYVTAYRSLGGTGLTVAVSLAAADILAPWRDEVYAAAAVVILAGLILLAAGIVVARAVRAGKAPTGTAGGAGNATS
jgi:hypothetical protein